MHHAHRTPTTVALLVAAWSCGAAEQPPLVSGALALEAGATHGEDLEEGALDGDWQLAEGRLFLRPHLALRLGVGLGYSREGYQLDGPAALPGLPDAVQHTWVRVPLAVMFHQHWGFTAQGSFGSGADDTASFADGRQWQVQAGPLYVRDENLIVALMVNVSSRIDRDPSIFPFPTVYWRFHPDWELTVVDEVDNVSRLTYAVSEHLRAGLRLDVRFREAAIGSQQSLADDHVAAALQVEWRPWPEVQVTPFAGAMLVRWLTLYDEGDEVWSQRTRPAPLLGLALRANF